MKILANNKSANFEYDIIREYEAGVVLKGWEVKSIKESNVSLKESFVKFIKNECWILNMHVGRWPGVVDIKETDLATSRKLLLNKDELIKLHQNIKIKGNAVIPLKIYLAGKMIKVTIALARGKKLYEKRQKLKEIDMKRQIASDLKHYSI
jgi:SsrA-binding protein